MSGGIEGESPRGKLTSQHIKPTEQLKPQQEGGNGSPGLPPTIHERAKPPPENTLSRAVERTRDLYEKNGWVFLPLGVAAQDSPGLPKPQLDQPKPQQDSSVNTPHTPLHDQSSQDAQNGCTLSPSKSTQVISGKSNTAV